MEKYNETMLTIAMIIGGITGFIKWISLIVEYANYDMVGWVIVTLVFGEILIPLMGLLPGLIWGAIVYLVCLPFYAIYKLIWRSK